VGPTLGEKADQVGNHDRRSQRVIKEASLEPLSSLGRFPDTPISAGAARPMARLIFTAASKPSHSGISTSSTTADGR